MIPKEITTLAGHRLVPSWVMKLALDVAAAEREACAKLMDDMAAQDKVTNYYKVAANAIRARSNQ